MNQQIIERRRLLRLFVLGSVALPAAALAGCAQGGAGRTTQPPRRYGTGGNKGGEKSGGGGGVGARS